MAAEISGHGLKDALVILGAAGVVIPAFARLKISPVIGFIIVGMIVGPFGAGAIVAEHPWLYSLTITDPEGIEPFAEFGIILLLFAIGLELSLRRMISMRRAIFGVGAAEMLLSALLIGGGLLLAGDPWWSAAVLGLALAMSSTGVILPIAGTTTAVGRAAFSMLLFEDIALVPLLIVLASSGDVADLPWILVKGVAVIAILLVGGRFLLPRLFAQAARTKSPELFLAISLLVVILASLASEAAGLSPIMGALVAGMVIAETDYHSEVDVMTAPFKGLALGVFLITVGMRVDFRLIASMWPQLLGALIAVVAAKAVVTAGLLRLSGSRPAVAAETGLLMGSPSETTLILIATAAATSVISRPAATFWQAVTALGLTLTPLLAQLGRLAARRVERGGGEDHSIEGEAKGRTVIFGFGRVGKMVADMLIEHDRAYLAVESDIDSVRQAREAGYHVLFGDVSRPELADKLHLGRAAALVLTMDDPVEVARITRRVRGWVPDLPIIARARDTAHAARLYDAGVTDAVPETLEASLQLSEAVLVDIGVAIGPVIASIHEKRDQLRAQIRAEADLEKAPRRLGSRRLRDAQTSGSNLSTPAT